MSKSVRFDPHQLYSGFSRNLIRIVLTAGAIVVVIWIAQFAFRASSSSRAEQNAAQTRAVVPLQNVRFTVYPEGIHPTTITVQKGLISIAIEDLADTPGGVLVERVGDNGRAAVGNIRRFQNHWRGRISVDLSPGTYELRVPDKSIMPAQLIVEP